MGNKPLYRKIVDDITADIFAGKLRPGDRVPSERELTEIYRVSQMTTKNALNELAEQNLIVRIKGKGSFVNDKLALSAHGYSLPVPASLPGKRLIGLILPMMKTKIDQELCNFIDYYAHEAGCQLMVKISRESQSRETEQIRELLAYGADGLIIFPTENELYNAEILKMAMGRYPLIFVDRYLKGIHTSSITTDNFAVTKQAILDMKARGASHIAFISPDSNNSVTIDRLDGFYGAFTEQPHPSFHPYKLMIDLAITDPREKEDKIREFIAQNPQVDGFFCVNREMSTLLLNVIGRHFPDYLTGRLLYGFDAAQLPNFTYIQQDTETIARLAVEHLLQLMDKQAKIQQLTVPADIRRPEFHYRFIPPTGSHPGQEPDRHSGNRGAGQKK